MVVKILRIQEK